MELIIIKVHGRGGKVEFPLEKRIERIRKLIDDTRLFDYIGESRIDGYSIFRLKSEIIRFGKLQKVRKIYPTVLDNLNELLDKIEDDIERISTII
jgi:hypothetical protein